MLKPNVVLLKTMYIIDGIINKILIITNIIPYKQTILNSILYFYCSLK